MKVGILSFQGSFLDHSKSIHKLGHESLLIKQSNDLTSVDALILPGGESTAMKKINQFSNLDHPAKPRWPLDDSAKFLKGAGVKL